MIIKIIHLMNLAKADTLTPIMRNCRPEVAGAGGIFRSSFQPTQNKTEKLDDIPACSCSRMGRILEERDRQLRFFSGTKQNSVR
jgi:hypothetical protein